MKKRIALAAFALSLGAGPTLADPPADCNQGRNPEIRMRACSEVIDGFGYGVEVKALAYRNRGNARADAGAHERAIADFAEAIRLAPDSAAAYAGRGRSRMASNDLDGAIADYGEALRLVPGSAPFRIGRGHAYLVKGDVDLAITDFTEAIRLNPQSASAFNRRGLAYRRKGDLAKAIDDYTAAIMINPIYALAYNNRGYVYEAQGKKDDAIADFQIALLLDPSLIGAKDGLKRLGAPPAMVEESERRVREGKALVEQNCAGCHAVGAKGASPNKKAPEFRNLHARHAILALREPLSRGIAAPHDEMPKFALTAAQIDTIVAYINSLTPTSVRPATAGKKTVVPIADSEEFGDPRKGLAYAQKTCAQCHAVLRVQATSPNPKAPAFKTVANTPGMNALALTVWLRTSHPTMPNLIIEPNDLDDVVAYIASLREKK
jgi:tetratricopeptide (TPR) repeat protein